MQAAIRRCTRRGAKRRGPSAFPARKRNTDARASARCHRPPAFRLSGPVSTDQPPRRSLNAVLRTLEREVHRRRSRRAERGPDADSRTIAGGRGAIAGTGTTAGGKTTAASTETTAGTEATAGAEATAGTVTTAGHPTLAARRTPSAWISSSRGCGALPRSSVPRRPRSAVRLPDVVSGCASHRSRRRWLR